MRSQPHTTAADEVHHQNTTPLVSCSEKELNAQCTYSAVTLHATLNCGVSSKSLQQELAMIFFLSHESTADSHIRTSCSDISSQTLGSNTYDAAKTHTSIFHPHASARLQPTSPPTIVLLLLLAGAAVAAAATLDYWLSVNRTVTLTLAHPACSINTTSV
jgi:hypothetical protein